MMLLEVNYNQTVQKIKRRVWQMSCHALFFVSIFQAGYIEAESAEMITIPEIV